MNNLSEKIIVSSFFKKIYGFHLFLADNAAVIFLTDCFKTMDNRLLRMA